MMERQRDQSFDFIKGILAFLVVWGHCIQYFQADYLNNPLYIWIYSFHMPLFVFISGYFALNTVRKGFKSCLYSRIQRLLIPALIWTALIFLIRNSSGITSVRGGVLALYNSFRNVWFLYCLFVLYMVANVVWKSKYRVWISAILVVLGYVSYPYWPIDVVKHFQLIRQWPLFVLGLLCREYNILDRILPKWSVCGNNKKESVSSRSTHNLARAIIFVVVAILYSTWLYFASVKHKLMFSDENYLIRGIILILASYTFLCLFKWLFTVCKRTVVSNIFVLLGSKTLGIYMTNTFIITWVSELSNTATLENYKIFAIAIVITAVCYALSLLFGKFKLTRQLLLGER